MMKNYTSYDLIEWVKPFKKSQHALPEPSLSEVLIRVTASVLCRSNLYVQKRKIAHYIMTILVMLFVLMAQGVPIAFANELSGRLIIVTSFPENVFNRFKSAFNERHPRIKIHVRSKKTSAAISFIQEAKGEPADILWASAPDAFEVLKKSGHLEKVFRSKIKSNQHILGYPVDDPAGYYRGFAISGYGIMWNRDYLNLHNLPEPRHWDDLRNPDYMGHIGISAPSRSGSMHLIIETILQGKGWDEGWSTLMEIAGNLATVTARSFGVLDGVKRGRFGVGPVIDFFGLSAIATGAPVGFTYSDATVFLPANIALLKNGKNPDVAKAFVKFILSSEGQKILLEPEISRLPIDPEIYLELPNGYPNPFDENLTKKGIRFDTELSRTRYHLVNNLFDIMITYRLRSLTKSWSIVREAESLVLKAEKISLVERLKEARRLISRVPVTANQAEDPSFSSGFIRRRPGLPIPPNQIVLEKKWEKFAKTNHLKAINLVKETMEELTK